MGRNSANDETGEPGWTIENGYLWRAAETNSWSTSGDSLIIAIKGTVLCDGIWCATLTVRDLGSSHRGCGTLPSGNECTNYLTEDEFTHAMTDYSVTAARVQSDGQLRLNLSPDITSYHDSESLVLHVGSETFAFEDANVKEDNSRRWNNSGLSWTTDDTIRLKLTEADTATEVPSNWSLTPPGLAVGDQFRLLFLSSTKTDATSTDIADYNTFIKDLAAAGHADIRYYSAGFRAVGCTADVDARDNTGTNTDTDGAGVPIYWVNGSKAADDYADFYDGSWDDEANDKNESGNNGPDTSQSGNRPFTGCDHNGTELRISGTSNALGATDVRVGRPNHSGADIGPLRGGSAVSNTATRPMYGLSQVFAVVSSSAMGQPEISGAPQEDMVLEAEEGTIADTDGLPTGTFPSGYTFEWFSVDASDVETPVGTNSSYTVSSSDVGSTIRVEVSFIDGAGNSEGPLPSEATAAVVPAAAECPTGNDWCATMTVGTVEVVGTGTFYGFLEFAYGQLDAPAIDYDSSFEVKQIYIFEPDGIGADSIYIKLDAYVPRGTVFNLGGTEFTADAGRTPATGAYIWIRPANFAWIDGQEVTVSANLPPGLVSAIADGTSLVLTYDQDLDTSSSPAASAYTVKVDGGTGTAPSSVSVGDRTVTLTLATAVTAANSVTLSYTAPASNPVQDGSGIPALSFTDEAVSTQTVSLVLSRTSLSVGEAGSGTFTVKLDTQPSANVTVTVSSDDTGAATVSPASLTFTTANWNSTQTVTVSGVNDTNTDNESLTVTASASGGGYGGKMATVSVSVTDNNTAQTVPGAPRNLNATAGGQTQIDLGWNAPTSNGGSVITGYKIEVSTNSGSGWSDLVSNTGNTDRTYAHTGLAAGDTRHYRVSAINRVGTGLASAVASGQTQEAGATPKSPSTMYLYFTVSNSDPNESEEVTGDGNRIDGDCSGEKYFRGFWTEPNSPPVDEWEVQATLLDGASAPSIQVHYSNGNREYPEFIGSAQFATGSGEDSYITFAVRGRYEDTWGAWGPTSGLYCSNADE